MSNRYIPVTPEEAEEEKKGGNIGLPFGLCEKYGIQLPPDARPRDAWAALKKKTGLSPEDFYKDLRQEAGSEQETIQVKNDKPERDSATNYDKKFERSKSQRGHIPVAVSKEKRVEYIQNELGVVQHKAKEYSEALYYYTDDFAHVKDIRAYQAGKQIQNATEVIRHEQALEEYIKKSRKWNGGETYRGIKLTLEELKQYELGSEHDMLGTSSWSSNEDIAVNYSGDGYLSSGSVSVVFHSLTQKNGTSVRHLSPYTNEDEVIVSKRSRYRVLKIKKSQDNICHIYLEEI